MYFTINNIKRAKSTFMIFSFIYVLSYIQLAIFYIYTINRVDESLLIFKTGFLIGVYGFLAGGAGIHYLIIKNYRHEMGNLETLGITRWQYMFQYWLSFVIVSIVAFIIAIIIFVIILQFFPVKNNLELGSVIIRSFINLFIFYNLFSYLFLFVVSIKDPFHLIKEKP